MRTNAFNILEFNVILQRLSDYAVSQKAKEKLSGLSPFLSEAQCRLKINETTQARKLLECCGTPPLAAMKELDKTLSLAQIGSMLSAEQLLGIAGFIGACRRMKSYLKKAENLDIELAFYGASFVGLDALYDEIDRCIRNDRVDDGASAALRDIRRKIENINISVKEKLESLLRSKKEWFADGYVTTRNGRLVLPVKKEYKNQISGTVVDTSGTGGTYFIEPTAVRKLHEELNCLQIDEDNEVRRILYTLTALVDENAGAIKINAECMETLDFAFAKAKLSIDMKAMPVPVTAERRIKILQGRHPLIKQDLCIPLDFEIGGSISGIVITGPNTGGKTVALKTVGLLSLMAQSGLHVPAAEGSTLCMNSNVLCDIGDGQSITENLSTFSAHITNIIDILQNVTDESLVLLDELGSGTDPAEGMGLAIAILDELKQRGCLFLATTHYPEIKDFADNTEGLVNARMLFDKETLKPLFKLQIGKAGESCALYIAQRLGFPGRLLNRAQQEAYRDRSNKSKNQTDIVFKEDNSSVNTSVNRIQRDVPQSTAPELLQKFSMGDSVMIMPQKEIGLVYKPANEKGELVVQIKNTKQVVNHKRVKLLTPASELYPDDYDFSIVFDTVENRKARHKIGKGHRPDLAIKYGELD